MKSAGLKLLLVVAAVLLTVGPHGIYPTIQGALAMMRATSTQEFFDALPGWLDVIGLPVDERKRALADAALKGKARQAVLAMAEDCLEFALANGEKFGIWGGMSERERRRIRRQRALARQAAMQAAQEESASA